MHCPTCGSPLQTADRFCPKCGTAVGELTPAGGGAVPAPAEPMIVKPFRGLAEDKGRRVLAFLIDIVPAIVIAVLNFMPVIGRLLGPGASAAYWLLRDITDSSPGKMVLGSRVVQLDGSPATVGQKILRNVTLAAPGLLNVIPFFGPFMGGLLGGCLFLIEVGMLLATGRRLGDMLANTTVVRR